MTRVQELEDEIAATRKRLDATIDRIQDKLTVAGMVDEVMGHAGIPKLASGPDIVARLVQRHPVPVLVIAAGIGFLFYSMSRRNEPAPARALRRPANGRDRDEQRAGDFNPDDRYLDEVRHMQPADPHAADQLLTHGSRT